MDDRSTVSIIRQTSPTKTEVQFHEEQQLDKKKDRVSPKIKVTGRVKLQLGKQTWVEVSMEKEGTVMIYPYHHLYNNLLCFAGTWIVDVKQGQTFHILIANFGA